MNEEITEQVFAVADLARLKLSNIRGSVEVTGGADEIRVTAIKHPDSGDSENTNIIMEQAEDGTVMVETKIDSITSWFMDRKPCKVDYRVQVPRKCALEIKTVSSSQAVRDQEGQILLKTVSGPIRLQNTAGGFKLKTVSGNIQGDGLSGSLNYDTVSGDVKLLSSTFEEINGKSVSGNSIFDTLLRGGPYQFNSVSGNFDLQLPEAVGFTVDMKSVSGRILSRSNPGDIPGSRSTGRHEIWGGGPLLRLKTVSGNLRLEYEGDEPVFQPAQDSISMDRMRVLEEIESGKITVEEGLSRLS
jgi:DUF4097 and DUF4098 domain-containing protein YvlB